MRLERTVSDNFATHCKQCWRLLTNPGYNKQSVFCCGKYRRWYDVAERTTVYDDGRDEKGRFHHKPYIIETTREILMEGGE